MLIANRKMKPFNQTEILFASRVRLMYDAITIWEIKF